MGPGFGSLFSLHTHHKRNHRLEVRHEPTYCCTLYPPRLRHNFPGSQPSLNSEVEIQYFVFIEKPTEGFPPKARPTSSDNTLREVDWVEKTR